MYHASQMAASELSEIFGRQGGKEDTYLNSVAYYLLTGRKGITVYTDGQAYVVVCQHPHIEDRLLVYPELGGTGQLTARILSKLPVVKNGIQLARYSEQDLQALQAILKENEAEFIFSELKESIMDWQYPALILDTKAVSEMKGSSYEKIRNKYNKVSTEVQIVSLHDAKGLSTLRAASLFWIAMWIYECKEDKTDVMDFHTTLLNLIELYPHMFDGFISMYRGEPAGFAIWDRPHQHTANAIAGVSRKSIKGLSEFQNVSACKILHEQGVKFYNLGGSETAELNAYKEKFKPVKTIKLHSYEISNDNTLPAITAFKII